MLKNTCKNTFLGIFPYIRETYFLEYLWVLLVYVFLWLQCVKQKVDPDTLSHLKLIIYRLLILLHKYSVCWASKKQQKQLLKDVPDKFWLHFVKFSLSQWRFLVPLLIGNFFCYSKCLSEKFPEFSKYKSRFQKCSLQKDMIRCSYWTLLVKRFEK